MTHGENGGCCGGANKDKKDDCCSTGLTGSGKIITVVSVLIAIGSLVYACTHSSTGAMAAKPKVDTSKLITGEDTVVATYNGEKVHKSDVALAIQELGAKVPPENVDAVLPAFIEQYINLRLISDAADKADVADVPEVQMQLSASHDQIVRAAFLRGLFEGQATEAKLQELYKTKFEDAPMPTEIRARHILVDSEAKAKDLIAQLKAGASFDKLAAENSKDPSAKQGGDLGYFVQTDMVKEFGDVAFTMPVGAVSQEPVKTQFGWHVIKIEDKRQRKKPSFEEAKQLLEQEINQKLLEEKIADLRKDAKVEVLVDTKAAPAAAPTEGAVPAPAEAAPADAAPAEPTPAP